jgi:hypothetical protein
MDWLSNHWAIGIGAGVISGLAVMLIVRHLFSGREQRDYQQNVAGANSEILQAIRPTIAQKIIPSGAMLDALFSATARKYGVDSRDLLPKAGFANELIKEVIDNTFLSSQQKVESCELLAGMKRPEMDTSAKRGVEVVTVTRRAEASDPSGILGLTTALMAFVMTVFFHLKDKEDFLTGDHLLKILPTLAIVSIIPIIAFLLLDLARQVTRTRRPIEDERNVTPQVSGASAAPRDPSPLESKAIQVAP